MQVERAGSRFLFKDLVPGPYLNASLYFQWMVFKVSFLIKRISIAFIFLFLLAVNLSAKFWLLRVYSAGISSLVLREIASEILLIIYPDISFGTLPKNSPDLPPEIPREISKTFSPKIKIVQGIFRGICSRKTLATNSSDLYRYYTQNMSQTQAFPPDSFSLVHTSISPVIILTNLHPRFVSRTASKFLQGLLPKILFLIDSRNSTKNILQIFF